MGQGVDKPLTSQKILIKTKELSITFGFIFNKLSN